MKSEPQAEHRWLEQLLGEWTITSDAPGTGAGEEADGADANGAQTPWTEHVRSLGGLWVVAEGEGEMPGGGSASTLMTLGYDPRTGRYVGTWTGSMMTHLWVYDGGLDPTGKRLILDCEGPDFETEGKLARYQDIITILDDDHRVLSAQVQTADGGWKPFMSMRYSRKK